MSRRHQIGWSGLGLAGAAVAIWVRDTRWMDAPADTLPLALGLPLAWMLGRPWKISDQPLSTHHRHFVILSAIVFGTGWLIGNLTLLAAGWTLACMVFSRWGFSHSPRRDRLAWLLLLSFPWLVVEWPSIGWAFRLSAAAVAQTLFSLIQIPVSREGTRLNVMGIPVDIEAACAGWNLLQLTLVTGISYGVHEIRSNRRFAFLLISLPAVAWAGNLIRILLLCGIALSFDEKVAGGAIHGITGLIVLGAVLAMTKGICLILEPTLTARRRIVRAS